MARGSCATAGTLYAGSSEADVMVLGTRAAFCHISDPCRRGGTGERVWLAVRASQPLPNKPPTSRMAALLRGKPSAVLPSLCSSVLARLFCWRKALFYPVQRNRGCSLPIFGISANHSLLIAVCAGKYQGRPPFSVTLNKGELANPAEQTGWFYTMSSVTISLFFFFLFCELSCVIAKKEELIKPVAESVLPPTLLKRTLCTELAVTSCAKPSNLSLPKKKEKSAAIVYSN